MTCPDCLAATQRPHYAFVAGCQGCKARAIARGPNFRRAMDSGRQDRQYRAELDMLQVTHDEVKAAASTDAECLAQAERRAGRMRRVA